MYELRQAAACRPVALQGNASRLLEQAGGVNEPGEGKEV